MKRLLLLCLSILVFGCISSNENHKKTNTKTTTSVQPFGIVLHGGAGTILKEHMTDSLEMAYTQVLETAIKTGYDILENGGTSLEAITKTINILEDSPLFNAGKGAVFTHDETNELDASIMDGATLNAGAVTGVKHIKNPIDLALKVMTNSPHVMLSGEGAEQFAVDQGFELIDSSYFFVQDRYNALQHIKASQKTAYNNPVLNDSKYGTVGVAALDKRGNLAAGTSTGGMTNKRWNRIGDTPIIGAGTYANNATCAVSSTGWGEFFIRTVVAHDISALMEYKGLSLKEAAREVIHNKVVKLGGDGGIVAIDKDGTIVMEFSTPGMYRASINAEGDLYIAMYKEEN